jgi:hypothetical protein
MDRRRKIDVVGTNKRVSFIIPLHINSEISWQTDGQIDFPLSAVNNSLVHIRRREKKLYTPKAQLSDCKIDFY